MSPCDQPSRVIQKQTDCFGSLLSCSGLSLALDCPVAQATFIVLCPIELPVRRGGDTFSKKISLLRLARFIFIMCVVRFYFYYVCLVFIVVMPDIKHLPCQHLKCVLKQGFDEFSGFLYRCLREDSLPINPLKCYGVGICGNSCAGRMGGNR